MYEEVFSFHCRPFTSTPFVQHYVDASSIQQAKEQTCQAIDRASGPVIVVGSPGTGKSLLLATLVEQYQSQYDVVNLSCARLEERRDLLQAVLFELKQPYLNMSEGELRLSLIDFLKPSERCPNGILLLVDDGHTLPVELIDELRLVTNFVRDGLPRVRLVLAGNSRLEETLNEPKLESFGQRIAARCFLSNLNREETRNYIRQHIQRAGGDGTAMFDDAATDAIHEVTEGRPRFINQVCEQAMILAATRGMLVVESVTIPEAWADVQSLPSPLPASGYGQTGQTGQTGQAIAEDASLRNDESWTVIEFGELDDNESVEEAFDDSSAVPIVADSEEHQELVSDSVEVAPEIEDSVVSIESLEQEQEDIWSAAGHDSVVADPLASNVEPETFVVQEQEPETVDGFQQIVDSFSVGQDDVQQFEAVSQNQNEFVSEDVAGEENIAAEMPVEDQIAEEPAVAEQPVDETFISLEAETAAADLDEVAVAPEPFAFADPEVPVANTGSEPTAVTYEPETAPQHDVVSVEPTAPPIANPFAENFDDEEQVESSFDSFVSNQNSTSLEVTPQDLEHLDSFADQDTSQTADSVHAIVDSFESGTPAGYTPDVETVAEPQPVAEQQADNSWVAPIEDSVQHSERSDVDPLEVEPLDAEPTARDSAQSIPFEIESMEQEPVEEYVAAVEEINQIERPDAQPETAIDVAPVVTNYHNHPDYQPTEDVQRRADEILGSIQADVSAQPVSCETVADESVATTAADDPVAAEIENDSNCELSDSQRILNEILEQKQLLNSHPAMADQQADDPDVDTNLSEAEPQSYSFVSPLAGEDKGRVDDSDMIVVNKGADNTPVDTNIFPSTAPVEDPVSTGRAERMDYQKLFDQLRNINEEQ